uniref:Uncharacterized protein n=1 Tax=Brassica oleracea TaxID=3712 RepID=A0A3P6CAB7_BRAOL|nr:unnamed protein product [Brassica oleracea]
MADLRVSRHPQTTSVHRNTRHQRIGEIVEVFTSETHPICVDEKEEPPKSTGAHLDHLVEKGLEGESTTTTYETAR